MKIPFIQDLLERRSRRRLRRIMRGYRLLRAEGRLRSISELKETLTNARLEQCGNLASSLIFGAGLHQAELIVRQYLLTRIGALSLNRALLFAAGKSGSAVMHPLPPQWRRALRSHGFDVATIRCAVAWQAWVMMFLAVGVLRFSARLMATLRERLQPRYGSLGRYAFFNSLSSGTLPQPCKDGRSHDVVTWYAQSSVRSGKVDALCHHVKGVPDLVIDGTPVLSLPEPVPPLANIGALLRFIAWGFSATLLACVDALRGRWWHAALLSEASSAAAIRANRGMFLASDYLFHNSGWIYRPLWTYEAAKNGAGIDFYFYSTNCEPFKQPGGYPQLTYGWQAMDWPRYLVWDEAQAEFVRRAVGDTANLKIVGPIWFQTSAAELLPLPATSIAVFDVQPMRNVFYQAFGVDFDYYTPATAIQFLQDICQASAECAATMAFKRKRHIGRIAHPRYRHYLRRLDQLPHFVAVDADISAVRLIENAMAVISMPFTSTALIGRELGKPSVYYDPNGLCQKDDRAAHGIEILIGMDELRRWVSAVVGASPGPTALQVCPTLCRSELA